SASSTAALTANVYDIHGRVTTATTTIQNIGYVTSYAYDRQGNVTGLTYPNGSQVNYSYNLAGQQSRVQRKPSGGSFSDIITSFDYAPHGRILNTLFGNTASTTYFYDPTAMYRLSNLQTTQNGATSTQKFAYTYDAVGNITQLSNMIASTTASATTAFTYDALNRLLSASAATASSSPYSQTYTYDLLGNMLTLAATEYSTASSTATTTPTILDTLPLTVLDTGAGSYSGTYTVPSGGTNKLLVVALAGSEAVPTVTLNGETVTVTSFPGTPIRAFYHVGVFAAPTTATLSVSGGNYAFVAFTLKDAAQTFSVDSTNNVPSVNHVTTLQGTTTTTIGYDFLASMLVRNEGSDPTWGASENEMVGQNGQPDPIINNYSAAWKAGAASLATEDITATWTTSAQTDHALYAIKAVGNSIVSTTTTNTYTYAGTNYANPHAVTQIGNGVSTTTYGYDVNGNVTQKSVDGVLTTYIWDYANRLTALGAGAATTTYSYDAFGARVLQTGTTTTYIYPSKLYSVASSTISGAAYATTTEYIWTSKGDTLVATVEQQFASGSATGTAQTSYIHPDHLGSTNVITNASGTVISTKDYYPFGASRINSGTASLSRGYIGEFSDSGGLSYLNARYYNPSHGQFLSHDPVFLAIGDAEQLKQITGLDQQMFLSDPQLANSTSYARNNPITLKDPDGKFVMVLGYAAIETAPVWLPWVGYGLAAAGGIVTGQVLYRTSGG
ncbi:hypothetical protein HY478_01770, partial [Candidatus Uhrbacteria bacterium]|nr:hypothetical protein [Candidatus Uhrbacteria bacterium]